MANDIPGIVTDQLDPRLNRQLLRTIAAGPINYYLFAQADDDIGGEALVSYDGAGARLVAADTTVFPLSDKVPAAVADAFADITVAGPQADEEVAAAGAPARLTPDELDRRVLAAAKDADGKLKTDIPGTDHGNLACAWAVNEVVRRALGRPIGGGLSTAGMFDVLRRSHIEIAEGEVHGGTIVISPTLGSNHGHVGIVGERSAGGSIGATVVYSNRSSQALFGHAFTLASWQAHFAAKGLEVRYFRLDPARFAAAAAADEAMAAWSPPGFNSLVDIYAGDAKDPDFAAIRAAGITGFIHKATDPLYRFNATLYMQRRSRARAAGLIWGSYHFGRAGDGARQADGYIDAIQPLDDEFVCLDFELPEGRPDTVMTMTQAVRFVERIVERLGKPPLLYGGHYLREQLAQTSTSPLTVCPLWFADYRPRPAPEIPRPWTTWSLWQWTGDVKTGRPGAVPSLEQCDRSTFNGTADDLRRTWRCRPDRGAAAAGGA